MSGSSAVERWRLCQEARRTALKSTDYNREEYHRAQEVVANIWNEWAQGLIEARKRLEAEGQFKLAKFDYGTRSYIAPETIPGNEATAQWLDEARVDFGNMTFDGRADFSGFIFPGHAIFGLSKTHTLYARRADPKPTPLFPAGARFNHATFHLDAVFDWVLFEGAAGFDHAHFCDIARFNQCVFGGTTWFDHAVFEDDLWLGQVKFKAYTDFSDANFKGRTSFYAIQSEGAFLLHNATFRTVPDFTQARFQGTPRIDGNSIPLMNFLPRLKERDSRELQNRYLALRQLAVAGHDHQSEAKAFKAEMRAKRGNDHRWWSALFWFSVAYDAASDFGQSMMRPFVIWAASIFVFCALYLAHASKLGAWSSLCVDGSPYWLKALVLALKNAILFVTWDREQIRSAYLCLYDLQPTSADQLVPTGNALIQAGQSVLSAILIFLFLLAVRNHFKIK
jgi:hypothetical protein